MRWLALGLKLRLETESPGAGFTCAEGKEGRQSNRHVEKVLAIWTKGGREGMATRAYLEGLVGVGVGCSGAGGVEARHWANLGEEGREGGGRAGFGVVWALGFWFWFLRQGSRVGSTPRPQEAVGSRGLDAFGATMLGWSRK
jgi:hypothetical protein